MKVMQRGIMRVVPGKMAEAIELNKEYFAILKRYKEFKFPAMRMYRPFLGGEYMHTIVFEVEWDSLATMAAFFEKVMVDPEVQKMMPKWETVLEGHEVEIYWVMP